MATDRVSYSFGMKINIAKFETADFHISIESDVKAGETVETAIDRVRTQVEKESEKKFDELNALKEI